MKHKITKANNCIVQLTNFVNNKYGNKNLEMTYGERNQHK